MSASAIASTPTVPEIMPGEVVLHDVGWDFYERFLRETANQRIRHVYDEGDLTIMAPLSMRHEHPKRLFARSIDALTEELGMPVRSVGSLTLASGGRMKGVEPDEAYNLANERAMRGRKSFDADRDPPPDLVIEIDVSRSSADRMTVYEALGVPEVWRYADDGLHVSRPGPDGTYVECDSSGAFPTLPLKEFAEWIGRAENADETAWIRSFREWVRTRLVPKS